MIRSAWLLAIAFAMTVASATPPPTGTSQSAHRHPHRPTRATSPKHSRRDASPGLADVGPVAASAILRFEHRMAGTAAL